MSIWNKVLVGLIIFASLGMFYLGMQALKTHRYWRESVNKHVARLETLQPEIERLKFGEVEGGNLREREVALFEALINRGRVWYHCMPQQVINAQTGEVRVATDPAGPHGITDKMALYVFEETDAKTGGHFLGEFRVKAVADKQVALEPTMTMTPDELRRLEQSKGPWTLRELLPSDIVEEGKPRPPRDYLVLLKEFDRRRAILTEKKAQVARHRKELEAAVADAKQQVQFRQNELTALKTELAELARHRDAALAHQKALEKDIADRKGTIAKLLVETRAVADEIAKAQFKAMEHIDRQTKVASN